MKYVSQSSEEQKELSPREQQIINLLATGLVSREIGVELNISSETVRSHLKHIYKKLNVRNKIRAIAKYCQVATLR
jgi:DNA-binding NarL/FixJ family response regulator